MLNNRPCISDEKKQSDDTICLPNDVSGIILDYYLNADMMRHPVTERFKFFGNDLNLREKLIAHHVLWGNQDKAESMILDDPSLLTRTISAISPCGQVKGALYQMALGMGDFYIKNDKGKTMSSMIQGHLISHYGAAEAKKQQDLQFPKGWEEKEKARQAADNHALIEVWQTIENSKAIERKALDNDLKIQTAIKKFKTHLNPNGPLSSGFYVNVQLLGDAFKLLEEVLKIIFNNTKRYHYKHFLDKFDLYCHQVIGAIEHRLPACDVFVLLRGVQIVSAAYYDSSINIPQNLSFSEKNLNDQDMFNQSRYETSTDYYDYYQGTSPNGLQLGTNAYIDLWSRLCKYHACEDLLGDYRSQAQSWQTYLNYKLVAFQALLKTTEKLAAAEQSAIRPHQPTRHAPGECSML